MTTGIVRQVRLMLILVRSHSRASCSPCPHIHHHSAVMTKTLINLFHPRKFDSNTRVREPRQPPGPLLGQPSPHKTSRTITLRHNGFTQPFFHPSHARFDLSRIRPLSAGFTITVEHLRTSVRLPRRSYPISAKLHRAKTDHRWFCTPSRITFVTRSLSLPSLTTTLSRLPTGSY
jgi:hypothetical protein